MRLGVVPGTLLILHFHVQGTDPKSVVCSFFKLGQCTKGDKCKFSHDLTIERKAEKRSLYCDVDKDADKETDTMDDWDEDKLKQVVEKKHETGGNRPTTDIVSYLVSSVFVALLSHYFNGFWRFRFVNISWKLWKRQNMVGSGNVRLARNAFIGMLCRRALF